MRRQGKFIQDIFDSYNEHLVQLPDESVGEMYQMFMVVYVEEADGDVLATFGLLPAEVRGTVPPRTIPSHPTPFRPTQS